MKQPSSGQVLIACSAVGLLALWGTVNFYGATADFAGPRRWLLRTFTMLSATRLLVATITGNIIDSFDDDGINRPRTWTALLRFLFVEPGILRRVALAYCAYFRPGFHPWLHDNRALAADAARDLAQTRAASAPA